MNKTIFHICEYGTIRSKADYPEMDSSLSDLYLDHKIFDDIFQSILEIQEGNIDSDKPFSVGLKKGKYQIRVKNFVGILESNKGYQIEILPKIHLNKSRDDVELTRKIFLNMLKRLRNSPFINLNEAQLSTHAGFPILEVFIQAYILETFEQLRKGLKSDYIEHEDNIGAIKGKVLIPTQLRKNLVNKSKFYCGYDMFSENIAANRIIKSTLIKLKKASRNHKNIGLINKSLGHFDLIESSKNYKKDFRSIDLKNRLFASYERIIGWSKIFLMDGSFTNFSGENRNLAILFPMERIFEDYIGYLVKKYSSGKRVKLQDRSYFLVENHKDAGKFRLKPDILAFNETTKNIIIDTKWKIINQFSERSNYNIKQSDMYQLYAYGKKYSDKESPKLVLLYPKNSNFEESIEPFNYEGDLDLYVIPFDLSVDEYSQAKQIKHILN
jgi:5-methylcytosine-specific restriction enzyme subunit McrC